MSKSVKDKFLRTIDYIRISVTDRCNFRCQYCMPEEGVEYLDHDEILSFEEILSIVRSLADLGIRKVKITGGEPFVRKGVPSLIKDIKAIDGIEQVTVTTNGVLLERYIEEIMEAGIDGINISMDTCSPSKFKELVRRDFDLATILNGIDALKERGFTNIKLNMVPIKGVNDDEIIDMIEFAKKRSLLLRFIELMPIGFGDAFQGLSPDDVMDIVRDHYGEAVLSHEVLGNGPAEYYEIGNAKIGFISAVSHKFCSSCNRIRMTANGFLKSCLHYDYGTDLKPILRNGEGLALSEALKTTINNKPEHHDFNGSDVQHIDSKKMFQIGG